MTRKLVFLYENFPPAETPLHDKMPPCSAPLSHLFIGFLQETSGQSVDRLLFLADTFTHQSGPETYKPLLIIDISNRVRVE